MTLSDPRALADFQDLLKIRQFRWQPRRNDQVDGQGTGELLLFELASPLWAPEITVDWMSYSEALRIEARLNSLTGLRSFYLSNPFAPYPAADPGGTLLGASSVSIATVGADNASVSLTGLPAGYALTEGDFFHVDFGANPVRRGLFQLSEPGVADITGTTPELAVFPHLWTGVTAGLAVSLAYPSAKCILVPGAITNATFSRSRAEGMTFSCVQRL